MIQEIDRESLLSDPGKYSGNVAVAFVSSPSSQEEESLSGWDFIKGSLAGFGARIGFRSYLGLVESLESIRSLKLEEVKGGKWSVVAKPINSDVANSLKEVEWRANKISESEESEIITILGESNAL